MLRKKCKLEKVYTSLPFRHPANNILLEGRGYYKIIGRITLEKALELVMRNRNYYTSIFVYDKKSNIIYKRDIGPKYFGVIGNSSYCDLSFWEMKKRVKKIRFSYFTNVEHVDIYL